MAITLTRGSYYKYQEGNKTIFIFLFAHSEKTGYATIFDTKELRDYSIKNIKSLPLVPSSKSEFEIALNSEIANLSYTIAVATAALGECHQMREILLEGKLKHLGALVR